MKQQRHVREMKCLCFIPCFLTAELLALVHVKARRTKPPPPPPLPPHLRYSLGIGFQLLPDFPVVDPAQAVRPLEHLKAAVVPPSLVHRDEHRQQVRVQAAILVPVAVGEAGKEERRKEIEKKNNI
ncbi:hypothetical protein E2C01_083974 [Portunus trituberculatus]|uniref:Uncharacterized protein n=1 Tax=Portunus trituberculatus TaxID=210409 RepID=A0A5B7J2T1_PORTR|nr:hypothetical protein [Portunus trituberculatus]